MSQKPFLKQIGAGIFQCSACTFKIEMTPAALSRKGWQRQRDNDFAKHVAREHRSESAGDGEGE